MAYVLDGVTVEIPDQATRPREPARPSRAFSLQSQMFASRQVRPRETIAPSAATNLYLNRLAHHRAQQAALEGRLKQVGQQLHAANAAVRACRVDCGPLKHRVLALEHEASSLIEKIRKCAAACNDAANAAVQHGASMFEVRAVAQGLVGGLGALTSSSLPASSSNAPATIAQPSTTTTRSPTSTSVTIVKPVVTRPVLKPLTPLRPVFVNLPPPSTSGGGAGSSVSTGTAVAIGVVALVGLAFFTR